MFHLSISWLKCSCENHTKIKKLKIIMMEMKQQSNVE